MRAHKQHYYSPAHPADEKPGENHRKKHSNLYPSSQSLEAATTKAHTHSSSPDSIRTVETVSLSIWSTIDKHSLSLSIYIYIYIYIQCISLQGENRRDKRGQVPQKCVARSLCGSLTQAIKSLQCGFITSRSTVLYCTGLDTTLPARERPKGWWLSVPLVQCIAAVLCGFPRR